MQVLAGYSSLKALRTATSPAALMPPLIHCPVQVSFTQHIIPLHTVGSTLYFTSTLADIGSVIGVEAGNGGDI
jgi:hypothetical protein